MSSLMVPSTAHAAGPRTGRPRGGAPHPFFVHLAQRARPALLVWVWLAAGSFTPARAEGPASASSDKSAARDRVVRHDLPRLLQLAHQTYPGLRAAQHAIDVMKRKMYQARWAWIPQAKLTGFLAPSSSVQCMRPAEDASGNLIYEEGKVKLVPDKERCLQTDTYDLSTFKWDSIFLKVHLEGGVPLYTFDKLGSARRAAAAGIEARRSQALSARDQLTQNVTKAYWGLKLAREILFTIDEGRSHLDKAISRIDKELEEDEGESTVTDLLRLKSASSEVDARALEAKKLEELTLAALASLTGQQGRPFDVDEEVLGALPGNPRELQAYLELTRGHRPDVRSLKAALAASEAALDLERARFYPDLALVGYVGYDYAPGVDRTNNAFYSNPYNVLGAGFGLSLSWTLDPVQQYGRYTEARASKQEAEAKRAEALLGIDLEVRKTLIELTEAKERMKVTARGEKVARSWLVSISQSMAAGLAESRDLTDALLAFFKNRLLYLQAVYDANVAWGELERVVGARVR